MNADTGRMICARKMPWMRIAALLVLLGQVTLADETSPPVATPPVYTDVATLPSEEGEASLFAFLPKEGRYVMKVKRGWSGTFLISGQHGKTEWMLPETSEVGGRDTQSPDNKTSLRDFFPSPNPVLEVTSFDNASKFVAVRQGVATLRYVSFSSGERPKKITCELRVEVEADTTEIDKAILLAVPQAKVKVTEVRSAALLTGTVHNPSDVELIKTIAEQFYPQIIMQVKASSIEPRGTANGPPMPSANPLVPQPPTPVPQRPMMMNSMPMQVTPHPTGNPVHPLMTPPRAADLPPRSAPLPRPAPVAPPRHTGELRALRDEVRALRDDVRELKNLLSRRLDQRDTSTPKPDESNAMVDVTNGMLAFTASWCGPCQKMQPIIDKLKRDGYPVRVVDIDHEPDMAKQLNITSIPHFAVVLDKQVKARVAGLTTEDKLLSLFKQFLMRNNKRFGAVWDNASRETSPEELQQLNKSLDREITVAFNDAPLKDVIKKLQDQLDVNIVIDPRGLEEEGVESSKPISIVVSGVSARSVFRLILEPLNLVAVIDNEVLKVTSRQRAEGEMRVISYSLEDLLRSSPVVSPAEPNNSKTLLHKVADLVRATIEPNSWDEVGGPASIRIHEGTQSLVIRQTNDVHAEIAELLNQIREKKRLPQVQREQPKDLRQSDASDPQALLTLTYAVADLIVPIPNHEGNNRSPEPSDWFRLIETITSEVDPECWAEAGGPCSIRGVEQMLALIIVAPRPVHERVAKVLDRERHKLDLNVVFEIKMFEVPNDQRFQSLGLKFDPLLDAARLDAARAKAMLESVEASGGEILTSPKMTTFNGNLAFLESRGATNPIVPKLYLRGSVSSDHKSIRLNVAIQPKSIVQDLINRTVKIDDGGYLLFDATNQAHRDNLGLAQGHRLYMLVHAKLLITNEELEKSAGSSKTDDAPAVGRMKDSAVPFGFEAPVAAVTIAGNVAIPTAKIENCIRSQAGQKVTRNQVKDDVDALIRTGWFSKVEPAIRPSDAGTVLVFQVLERDPSALQDAFDSGRLLNRK